MSEKDNTSGGKNYNKVATEVAKQTVQEAPTRAIDKLVGQFILKPCKKTWLEQIDPKHDGAYLFSNTKIYLAPERDISTGLVRTGLTNEQARELEREMGLREMDLSPYSSFWNDFKNYPKIPQEGLVLDLTRSAKEKLMYLFCLEHTKVAKSWADAMENPFAEVVMTNKEIEAEKGSKDLKLKIDAMVRLKGLSINEQMEFLTIYQEGKFKVKKDSTPDFIFDTIGKVAETDPQGFIDLLNNPYYKEMAFVKECEFKGIIRKSGTIYYSLGGDKIGSSFFQVVENLQKPEYNELKISLKAKLDALR
jgi:hypothetical protein